MDTSIFLDLTKKTTTNDLEIPLHKTFPLWMKIRDFVFEKYPNAFEEWHFAVKKYGCGFRIKDKKRAIIYLSPREGFFQVAMVFGQKATDKILAAEISENIKTELINSKIYVEGRVVRLDINDNLYINDIKKLIEIKIAN
jgi:hypothetical protein